MSYQLNFARDEEYDGDSSDELYQDDETDLEGNSIGRQDELRQFIANPRKRRQRRRKHQGKEKRFP